MYHRDGLLGMTSRMHNAIHKKNDDALPITRYAPDGTATPVGELPTVRAASCVPFAKT